MKISSSTLLVLAVGVQLSAARPSVRQGAKRACRPRPPGWIPPVAVPALPLATSSAAYNPVVVSSIQPSSSSAKIASTTKIEPIVEPTRTPAPVSPPGPSPSPPKEPESVLPPPPSTSEPPAKPSTIDGGSMRALFPSGSEHSWTTSGRSDDARSLSDNTLVPTQDINLPHPYVSAPDGSKAMKVHYPRGSYTFTHQPRGGVSFYAHGPADVDLTTAREATFGYAVMFPHGFEFNLGGKLPGFYGGDNEEEATRCSGGHISDACFSARIMWRDNGEGEFYTYFPRTQANEKLCSVAPSSHCNPEYGTSVGRGSFTFERGLWTVVSERVKLNDIGRENGEIELFADGRSVISVKGLVLRTRESSRFRGLQIQSFFGGSGREWASPKDQDTFFKDFSVAILSTL